jgi:hypothetical protein
VRARVEKPRDIVERLAVEEGELRLARPVLAAAEEDELPQIGKHEAIHIVRGTGELRRAFLLVVGLREVLMPVQAVVLDIGVHVTGILVI